MADMSVLSDSEAVRFLEWLDPTGLHNLVALDPTGAAAPEAITVHLGFEREDAEGFINRHNGKRNLYFSINAPRVDARKDTKLRRDEIGAVRAFHVDIDNLEGEPDWDPDCLPSAVIDSGGGRWGFWKLEQPIPVEDVAAIEAQNRALTARFDGDAQAHNLDRIARLPGTLNIPNTAKRKKGRVEVPASVLSMSSLAYSPAEVAEWCPPAPKSEIGIPASGSKEAPEGMELDAPASVSRAIAWLHREAPEAEMGNGSDQTTYQVAAKMRDFGISEATAFDLLLDHWNDAKSNPPWPAAKLQKKVTHAYRYGTAMLGKNSPALAETEFEAVDLAQSEGHSPPKRQMQAALFDDIAEDFSQAPNYLIEDWYDQESTVVTYGESNSGKTHVVLDQSLAIAAGRPWAGKKVHQGLVVYVAAEGGRGVKRRVMAHRAFRPEHKNLPFALVAWPINLMHAQADTKALIGHVKALEAQTGQKCVMVVIDTLSRALSGGDENSSADMGAFVKRCDEIRFSTGAALHIIHHAGKNTAKGARGHSLLRAAVDTEIEIESSTIMSRKQRDMEAPQELRFDYKPVQIGVRPDGSEVRSVVLDVWPITDFDPGLTPQTQKVLDAIEGLITQKTQNNGGIENPRVSLGEIKALGFSGTTVDRAFGDLVVIGTLAKCKRGLYELKRNPKTPD